MLLYFYTEHTNIIHSILKVLKNPEEVKIIMSYGKNSIIAFIALQVIQVVLFFIPGEIIQIAGGYIFDSLYGSLFSLIGITIGGSIVFSISRFWKTICRKNNI